jgi:hypothetical protein
VVVRENLREVGWSAINTALGANWSPGCAEFRVGLNSVLMNYTYVLCLRQASLN